MSQKEEKEREAIIAAFMEHTLEKDHFPKSIYKFCKENKMQEKTFYKFFGSFQGVRQMIWETFYDNVMSLLRKDENFDSAQPKEKLLSFYFTFFEVLLLNRSYLLFALSGEEKMMTKVSQLSSFRKLFKGFAAELIEEGNVDKPSYLQHPPKIFSEAAWVQLGFLLKFWMEDSSADFEKTDQAIEKSVQTAFDVFDNTPLSALVDFGKFLWKEKFAHL
ncbi:TetR family transcriptional regulator C-terminal domain-containing protein [Flavobacteriaceae bacterium]|nr:TetR family transcriptional regulator C-terminal domain-containing protein [Flavobacteriaceae bacterium]